MIHHPKDSRPESVGSPEYFHGHVTIQPIIDAPAPARLRGVLVRFQAGARTYWHTHPLGQTIIILSGKGRAQRDGGVIVDLTPGDVVFFEPGEKHWHGAATDQAMEHYALQEALDGSAVTWLEAVSGP